jgi:hypothetical protein
MKICSNCIINEKYPNITFDKNGKCSLCNSDKTFTPIGEDFLIKFFDKARNKNRQYMMY